MLLTEYYSRYVEMSKLHCTTSAAVIQHMKSIFAPHGMPEILFQIIALNSLQQASSPLGNEETEWTVKTVKSMLQKATNLISQLL